MISQIGIFRIILSAAVLAAVLFPQVLSAQERIHIVQSGETFYSIARAFGLQAEDLMRHNEITDPRRLREGQSLRIPVPAGTAASSNAGVYRVVRGDTLYGLARRFSVTLSALLEANNLPENYVLREGDVLRLPSGAVVPPDMALAQENAVPGTGQPAPPAAAPLDGTGSAESAGIWPVTALEFSYMTGGLSGVAITGTRGESVKSLTRGLVLSAGPYRGFGRVAIVQVEGSYLYVYGGCERLSVKEGDRVNPGTEIGTLGTDAVTNKSLLFFMVYRNNVPVDPAKAPRA